MFRSTTTPTTSRLQVAAASVLLALALAACGSGDEDTVAADTEVADTAAEGAATETDQAEVAPTPAEDSAETEAEADGAPADDASGGTDVVTTTSTDLGDVLSNTQGLTLYGFTNDSDGTPTCEDACADAWPPVSVDSADLPDGVDSSVFSVVERSDGTFQLAAGDWPLYTFAGDSGPGDVNGQGSGDVWFAVAPDGSLIRDTAAMNRGSTDETAVDQADGY